MAKKLKDLDKDEWKRMKKAAGIKSSPWFKKSDASVGSFLKKMEKAKKQFEYSYVTDDLLDYLNALVGLKNAFDSFLAKKDFTSTEAQALKTEIESWKTEIDDKDQELRGIVVSLGAELAIQSDKAAKRDIWDKNGLADTFNL